MRHCEVMTDCLVLVLIPIPKFNGYAVYTFENGRTKNP